MNPSSQPPVSRFGEGSAVIVKIPAAIRNELLQVIEQAENRQSELYKDHILNDKPLDVLSYTHPRNRSPSPILQLDPYGYVEFNIKPDGTQEIIMCIIEHNIDGTINQETRIPLKSIKKPSNQAYLSFSETTNKAAEQVYKLRRRLPAHESQELDNHLDKLVQLPAPPPDSLVVSTRPFRQTVQTGEAPQRTFNNDNAKHIDAIYELNIPAQQQTDMLHRLVSTRDAKLEQTRMTIYDADADRLKEGIRITHDSYAITKQRQEEEKIRQQTASKYHREDEPVVVQRLYRNMEPGKSYSLDEIVQFTKQPKAHLQTILASYCDTIGHNKSRFVLKDQSDIK